MGKPNKIGSSIKINHLETQQLQAQSEEELDRVRGGGVRGFSCRATKDRRRRWRSERKRREDEQEQGYRGENVGCCS